MRAHGQPALEEARKLTDSFNKVVEDSLTELASHYGVRFYRLDVHSMAERVRENPNAFGFLDIAAPCKALPNCEGYLFWDEVHPTTQAHARLAVAALEIVTAR